MVAEQTEKKSDAPAATALRTTPAREAQRCREKDCKHPYRAKGYCVKHYRLWRQGKVGKKQRYKICTKEACRKPRAHRGLCEEHFKAAAGSGEAAAPPSG